MSKLKISAYSVSLDGFGAGPNQSLKNPLGEGGPNLHQWIFPTKFFHQMTGQPGGEIGVDNEIAEAAMKNMGAWIMGRNMFTPSRGPWPQDDWKGWWGPNPPYHCPVFVLTHHARPPLEMEGGTTFYFVTDGIESALKQAKHAAQDKDIRIGGGAATIRQYLAAGLVDEIHFALSPAILGQGEPVFSGLDLVRLGYKVVDHRPTARATHITLRKGL